MSPCGPRRSSPPTGTPTSTRSRRCSPRGASTRARSSRVGRAEPERPRLLPPACRRARRRVRGEPARARRDPAARRRRGVERLAARRARERRARSRGREGALRPPPRARRPGLGFVRVAAVFSTDGALTTTLVGILAERELAADAARGDRVRARHPRGHRLADVRDDDPARRRRARLVPAPRRAPGARHGVPAHAARRRRARAPERTCMERLEPVDAGGEESSSRRSAGPSTSTASRTSRTRSSTSPTRVRSSSSWRWTSACSSSCAVGPSAVDAAASPARSAAAGTRRRPRRSLATRARRRSRARARRALETRRASPASRADVMSTPARVGRPGRERSRVR